MFAIIGQIAAELQTGSLVSVRDPFFLLVGKGSQPSCQGLLERLIGFDLAAEGLQASDLGSLGILVTFGRVLIMVAKMYCAVGLRF